MSTSNLMLSEEERTYLEKTMEGVLVEKQREFAHTDTADFREFVRHEQELLEGMLMRLRSGAE